MKPLDNALAGAQRGANLTQRLLAFARKQDLQFEPVDIIEAVRGMAELLRSSVAASIRVETQFPLRLSPAHTDANQLELAILNLVLNARDAMPEGGKIVLSGSEQTVQPGNSLELAPGDYVCLSVADTGIGMDAETLARAAEPFFTTKGVGKGTGLGLPMVYGVAAQSGGRLILKSKKGKGTTAEIWLPRASAQKNQRTDGPDPHPRTENLTILIVDDDALVLRNIAVMLEDFGHSTMEARSGEAALKVLRERADIALVITDQVMPEMTGLQLADAIKAEWGGIPVVLASGYSELPIKSLGYVRLQKPFAQAQLSAAIERAISSARSSKSPRIKAVR
jgi:CheY-like chemotaxis protein/anti-sigma regulatory factor (Ser/Thr protein kinase)